MGFAFRSAFRTVLAALVVLPTLLSPLPALAQDGDEQAYRESTIEAPGPEGALVGTLTLPTTGAGVRDGRPVVLVVPGSGPTDRDGNSPLGIRAAPYRQLAHALSAHGIASVRFDKRGMFASDAAIPDPNQVTVRDYADDLVAWTEAIRDRMPSDENPRCVIPLGHSEGGLVALAALRRLPDPCGIILVATPGRPFGTILREQLRANPANVFILAQAEAVIDALESGGAVDDESLDPALRPLFGAPVQGFVRDLMRYDPAALAADLGVPVLIVQGEQDLQVGTGDARRLAEAAANATLVLLPNVNHVLKVVPLNDPAANLASYGDSNQPIASELVNAVVEFLETVEP